MMTTVDYYQFVQSYLTLFQDATVDAATLVTFYDPDVIWREMPNLFAPYGRSNNLPGLLAAWKKGKEAVAHQKYTVHQIVVENDSAVVELDWEGRIVKPVGELPAGTVMRAHVAIVIEFRAGKIIRQRDYICYYPLTGGELNLGQ